MRLEISFRNTTATEEEKTALRERVERKIKKVTRFLREPIEGTVNVRGLKVGYSGELHVSGAGGQTLSARTEGDDPIAVVDGLLHTVGRTARRQHDRRIQRSHKAPPATDGFVPGAAFYLADDEDDDLETEEIRADLENLDLPA